MSTTNEETPLKWDSLPSLQLADDLRDEFEPLFDWHRRRRRGANLGLILPPLILCAAAVELDAFLPSYTTFQFLLVFMIVAISGRPLGRWLAGCGGYRAAFFHRWRLICLVHRNVATRALVATLWEEDAEKHAFAQALLHTSERVFARRAVRKFN